MSTGRTIVGALVGGAALAGAVALTTRKKQPASAKTTAESSSAGYKPSPERIVKRASVNRENMADIYAGKPFLYKIAKRVFDIALSSVGLVVLSPVFVATAIAIAVEDGRPIFLGKKARAHLVAIDEVNDEGEALAPKEPSQIDSGEHPRRAS